MNFTAAAVASVPTETNLLLGVHLRSSTAQRERNKQTHMRRRTTIRQTGKSDERHRDVPMHPSKFREMGTGPGDAAPALLPPFLSPTTAPSAPARRQETGAICLRQEKSAAAAAAPPVLEKSLLSQQNRTRIKNSAYIPRKWSEITVAVAVACATTYASNLQNADRGRRGDDDSHAHLRQSPDQPQAAIRE